MAGGARSLACSYRSRCSASVMMLQASDVCVAGVFSSKGGERFWCHAAESRMVGWPAAAGSRRNSIRPAPHRHRCTEPNNNKASDNGTFVPANCTCARITPTHMDSSTVEVWVVEEMPMAWVMGDMVVVGEVRVVAVAPAFATNLIGVNQRVVELVVGRVAVPPTPEVMVSGHYLWFVVHASMPNSAVWVRMLLCGARGEMGTTAEEMNIVAATCQRESGTRDGGNPIAMGSEIVLVGHPNCTGSEPDEDLRVVGRGTGGEDLQGVV
ncbi:hypothetical protein HU200_009644 [Digitaria exilis]|uniref:Galactose oxidase-like Early set domain-containing protein n=1 Tax=Digitaria exilis TaxID=1010633 RepID=A0A835FKI1_9POAL|nr:hypothetical protein HU200_009644 [Digitaria exilis]